MEYAPPPFFKQGPSAFARLMFFALSSIALLVADARYQILDKVRFGVALVLYPAQRLARAPGEAIGGASGYVGRQDTLLAENQRLKAEQLDQSRRVMSVAQIESENAHLRKLLAMRERLSVSSVAAQVLYDSRDPFTRKVIIDRGVTHGIAPGMVVVDGAGVIGQITRAYPFLAEVSLLTDRDQAIPVQVVRNGLRAIAYGTPAQEGGTMELRFLPANTDVQQGDVLVTSGIDGTYLPGLPVATVARIEREAGYAFAKIVCTPAGGVDRHGHVLVLKSSAPPAPPPPVTEPEEKGGRGKKKRLREAEGAGAALPSAPTK